MLYLCLVLFVLLYADDMILLADNCHHMQHLLNVFDVYCNTWKLIVNCTKTKVLICGGSKDYKTIFKLRNMILKTVQIYKYLGIIFQY